MGRLPTNAAIQAALASKALDNNASIPEMKYFLEKYSVTKGDLGFLKAVHVAGSKGKGSVCAFAERMLRYKGLQTGMFTSPHLVDPRERIRINGIPVSKEIFAKHVIRLDHELEGNGEKISYFRFIWILALDIFREAQIEVGIIEVGMGGRFDATNVIENPTVCGITSLAMEHVNILGPTIREIAWNKAGIIKKGVPIHSVRQKIHPEAEDVIRTEAEVIGAPLTFIKHDSLIEESWELGIDGSHQRENAALASQLVSSWFQIWRPDEQLEKHQLQHALMTTKWPGRQQIEPLSDSLHLYLDGSHTLESIASTAKWFESKSSPDRINILYFHCSPDRDYKRLLMPLLEISHLFESVCFVIPDSVIGDSSKIKIHHDDMTTFWNANSTRGPNAITDSGIPNEIDQSTPKNYLVCGSLYLVGHFMKIYGIDP